MNLCIFPGTFNPIHKAHLKMAQYTLDDYNFDKIIFIPSCNPPHKEYDITLSEHRLNMVKLAVQSNLKFEVSDIEFKLEGKSYTYLTVTELYKLYDVNGKLNMIIGKDAYEKIDTWYEAKKLKSLTNFIVYDRVDGDISSSEIRERIKNNKPVNDFITKEVGDYIEKYRLYK